MHYLPVCCLPQSPFFCVQGLAIQWGAIGDVGAAYDLYGGNRNVTIAGTVPQGIDSCLSTLDTLLCQPEAVVSCFVQPESSRGKSEDAINNASLRLAVARILGEYWKNLVDASSRTLMLAMS